MTHGVPAKVIAASLGLAGFSIALIAGLAADNPADHILSRAVLSMIGCNLVGLVIGLVAEKTVQTSISAARERARGVAPSPVSAVIAPAGAEQSIPTDSARTPARA